MSSRVPIGPFADWCTALIERHEGSVTAAAETCEVNEAQMRRWSRGEAAKADGTISIARVDEVLIREGSTALVELYPSDGIDSTRVGRPNPARKMTDRQIAAAHVLYTREGLSLRELAELLYQRFDYASVRACKDALNRAFLRHGLALRDVEAARVAALRQPSRRCVANITGRRSPGVAGDGRCNRFPQAGSKYCAAHDPANTVKLAAHFAQLRDQRAAQPRVPIGPLSDWVSELRDRHGTATAVGRLLGCNYQTIQNLCDRVQSNHEPDGASRRAWDCVSISTIRRYLDAAARAGLNPPDITELYPELGEAPALSEAA